MAHVTDYDVWHVEEAPVTVTMVIERLLANVEVGKQALFNLISTLPAERQCDCAHALDNALITNPVVIPEKVKRDLTPLIGKYVPATARKTTPQKSTTKKSATKKHVVKKTK
jgi:5'-methylthioadenosine phosphorylase